MGARWIQPVPGSQRPRLRRHGRTLTALAGIVAAATLISACGSGSHATSQKSSVLTVGIVPANVPTSLNPAKTLGAANEDVYVLAYEPILHIESDGSYVFEDVPEGEYTIIATGYPPAASALRIAGGNQSRHDIELSF